MKKHLIIYLVVSILLFLVFVYLFWDYSIDDAFITFRFAENLVNGDGLVFNPGDRPVEAYSNFLWLLVLAFVYLLGLPIYLSAKILGVLCFLFSGLIWLKYGLKEQNKSVWLAGPLFLITPITAFWAVSGLELGLYSLLLTGFCLAVLRNSVWSFLFGSLIVITRLEGFGIALIILSAGWLADYLNSTSQKKYYLKNIIVLVIVLIGLITFRMIVFGYPMPNTFYMKLTASYRGILQLGIGLLYFTPVTLLFVWGLYRFIISRQYDKDVLVFSIAFLSQAIVSCAADAVMNFHFRYMIPFLPLMLCIALISLDKIENKKYRYVILTLICFSILTPYRGLQATNEQEQRIITAQKELIKHLNTIEEPITISMTDIGRIPYYTKATYYDLWGLASEDIAHGRSNALIEYLRFPDYFIFVGYIKENKLMARFGNDRLIMQNRGFKQAYEPAFVAKPVGAKLGEWGYYYFAYEKNQQAVDSLCQFLPPEYRQ